MIGMRVGRKRMIRTTTIIRSAEWKGKGMCANSFDMRSKSVCRALGV